MLRNEVHVIFYMQAPHIVLTCSRRTHNIAHNIAEQFHKKVVASHTKTHFQHLFSDHNAQSRRKQVVTSHTKTHFCSFQWSQCTITSQTSCHFAYRNTLLFFSVITMHNHFTCTLATCRFSCWYWWNFSLHCLHLMLGGKWLRRCFFKFDCAWNCFPQMSHTCSPGWCDFMCSFMSAFLRKVFVHWV